MSTDQSSGRPAPVGARLGRAFWRVVAWLRLPGRFPGTPSYWQSRYARGGSSGAGSRGRLAEFKAEVLNDFVARHRIASVIEFGCGDGSQLRLAKYPRYLGLDISDAAVAQCARTFADDPTKAFRPMREYRSEHAELALSLDVVYHLVEDGVFDAYMHTLLDAATRWVIIYSSDTDDNRGFEGTHIRHRRFTRWIAEHRPEWTFRAHIPNRHPPRSFRRGSFADFFIFERVDRGRAGGVRAPKACADAVPPGRHGARP